MKKSHFEWRRVDLDAADWQEAVSKSVTQGRAASETEGFSALTVVVLLLAAASAGLYFLEGMSGIFLLAASMFLSVVCICYVLIRMLVGVETSLTILSSTLELYGNQVSKQLSPNKANAADAKSGAAD